MMDEKIELSRPARNFFRMSRRYGVSLIVVEMDGAITLTTRGGGGREFWDEYIKAFKENEAEITPLLWSVQQGRLKHDR
jgi:hypothetical protein